MSGIATVSQSVSVSNIEIVKKVADLEVEEQNKKTQEVALASLVKTQVQTIEDWSNYPGDGCML